MFLLKSVCLKQLLRQQVSGSKYGCSALPLISRALSSLASEDISIVSQNSPTATELTGQSAIYSQSDITEPKHFDVEALDLCNVNSSIMPTRETWIENMSTPHSIKLAILPLHPLIFGAFPRPDYIQENHKWQTLYKHVDWRCMRTRGELQGTNKKPWPQKGMGRARHGDRLAPQFKNGGWATGPRGPRSYFYMLQWPKRVAGLISTLSCKFAQNDIHVVDTFESFPLDGTAAHLEELCEARGWGPSVLFVDKMGIDSAPQATTATHFSQATESINHINVVPMYGLNIFSMLKHETLVLTVDAIKDIESKLLLQLKRVDLENVIFKYKPDRVFRV